MNNVFVFLNYNVLYERCVMASVAHAIMVGKYDLLSAEQSWDGLNYNFQNMEGVRGVISFSEDVYICAIQNTNRGVYTDQCVSDILCDADEKICSLARQEALQYMLIDYNMDSVAFITSAFWGGANANFSNQSEQQIIDDSEKTIVPFLYNENDAKKYWKNYYEMTNEQIELAEEICTKRLSVSGKFNLTNNEVKKLKKWFGNIDECIESFRELGIELNN